MKSLKIFICSLLILSSTAYAQKSRLGETATFSSKINLISFDNTTNLSKDSIVKYKKPIAIFFWLSSCGPCIKELNAVHKMDAFKNIKTQARIIVVSNDKPSSYLKAQRIAKNNSWKFSLFFDKNYQLRNSLLNRWYGIPQVMVLDKNKKIVLHKFGYYKGDENKIIDQLKKLIHK